MAADFIITITDRSRGGEFAAWFQGQGATLVLTALARGTATTEILDCLGLEAPSLPDFERDAELEKRVLDEILSPAFSGEQPEGLLRVVRFKIRRWWANRWKHRLVFDEGLAGAFVHSAWAHLKRPRSIAH